MKIRDVRVRARHRQDLGDVSALAASMREVGLLHPIVVTSDGRLIAGERRLAAAKLLEWDVIPSTVAKDLDDVVRLKAERDENTQRKDFLPTEAVSLARALEPLERKAAKQRQGARTDKHPGKFPEGSGGNAKDKVAAAVGVDRKTLAKAEAVVAAAEENPETFGDLPEQMDRTGNVHRSYSQLQRRIKAIELEREPDAPKGKYRVIYADPPWSYADKADDGSVQGKALGRHYDSMSIAQLCELPVPEWCAKDAVLFLWVTSPLLFESAAVIKAWGFTYKASFVWDKVKHNMGHYNSVRHEFLLVCTKGSCVPDNLKLFDSVQSIERTTHSTKPEEFRRIIEALYPHGRRLELFARRRVDGWDAWGNQAEEKAS